MSNRSISADADSKDSQVFPKAPITTPCELSDHHSKDKTSACYPVLVAQHLEIMSLFFVLNH